MTMPDIATTPGYIAHLERVNANLEAELAEARRSISDRNEWTEEDKPLPEDGRIKAAHPTRTGDYTTYAEAQRMVGAKRSKYALIDLLNYWLVRLEDERRAHSASGIDRLKAERDDALRYAETLKAALAEIASEITLPIRDGTGQMIDAGEEPAYDRFAMQQIARDALAKNPAVGAAADRPKCDCRTYCAGRDVDRGGIVRSQCQGLPSAPQTICDEIRTGITDEETRWLRDYMKPPNTPSERENAEVCGLPQAQDRSPGSGLDEGSKQFQTGVTAGETAPIHCDAVSTAIRPCPFCGEAGYIDRSEDADGMKWARVRCRKCRAEAEAKWCSPGNDDPQFYAEVRDNWNRRAMPVLSQGTAWVPVTERMPSYMQDVLCTVRMGGSLGGAVVHDVMRWTGQHWLFGAGVSAAVYPFGESITHWQPLPMPAMTVDAESQTGGDRG